MSLLKNITYKLFSLLISLLFIFPILKENISSGITIILCINTLLYTISIKNYKAISTEVLFLTIPFWIILSRSLFSNHFSDSINHISHSLFFLIIPLFFFLIPKEHFNLNKINHYLFILKSVCLLIAVIYIVSFLVSVPSWKYEIISQNISVFRDYIYSDFKYFVIHPTYYTSMLILCSAHSLEQFLNKKKYYEIIFVFVFLTITLLLLTRLNIVLLLITLFYILLFRNKLSGYKKLGFFTVVLSSMSILIYLTPGIKERFVELYSSFNIKPEAEAYDSTNTRKAIFDCSVSLSKENFITGVGFENLQSELNSCFRSNYDSDFYKKNNYMTHNYYFYIFISSGIIGLLFYLIYLFNIIKIALKNKSFLFNLFLLNTLIVCLIEDYLYRHYGLLYFNLMLVCFIQHSKTIKDEIIK
ncbi:MAG: O-antigen ligase family protein, partial [Flavobacterium sp.]